MPPKTYTKQSLIDELISIKNKGWIEQKRNVKNAGSIGNTLEDLLGIEENNLPLPNAAEWELKTQRKNTNSLLTLFHMEPSPTALKIVPYLLNNFGWRHEEAGKKYPESEKSFRQTLSYHNPTIRGFDVDIDEKNSKVIITFNFDLIDNSLSAWRDILLKMNSLTIDERYIPYWGFNDLFHKAGTKLKNCFFVIADEKKINGITHIKYEKIMMLSNFKINKMIDAIKNRNIYIDFDARSGHNHGTKFRLRINALPDLYEDVKIIE